MWGSAEEPPGGTEAGPPESVANLKETCEQSKNQLEAVKDIMLRNKQSLKKKEEEIQEYANKLSKFKTRKASRPPKDDATSSSESTPKSKSDISMSEPSDDTVDDISQAKTPKAKSSLLQKKLAEDRKIFEQRSKELTESKRAVEEKVEALRQQLEETYVSPVVPVNPVLFTSQLAPLEISNVHDKDNKISQLNSKIREMEATIIDLQDNLKEKDSVIDSKTKAITLMSADLSRKGKTTLDTLEDTKDEMRSMQQNFVLVEESLRNKNDHLLQQLQEKNDQVTRLEQSVQSLTEKLEAQKEADVVNADFSRSTMDRLAETKDAMTAMQENFVLIESSLKSKNEHLLKQLEEREMKLAEAEARILNLETGVGIQRHPDLEDLLYKVDKLEKTNHHLEDEKYELQKSIADLQDKIIAIQSEKVDDSVTQREGNRLAELEAVIEELKKSSESVEKQLKSELEIINEKNEQMSRQLSDLESEKVKLTEKLSSNEAAKDDERVEKLTQELDDLNKSMIKLKAQHKNKLKNLQKQLENFKKVSDTNAELVRLGNQVALLEEEKGNLQLSLVDFDELKASAVEWKERINDLEGKVSTQAKEIEAHIEAIAILENQKLDLMQELHAVKQEVSNLEEENAESENLRVSVEMKVVDLEEELESLHRLSKQQEQRVEELQRQLESTSQENERLSQQISKLEELKSSSESFVKTGSNVDSTESFEALAAEADKAELLRKIDALTRENGALQERLARSEEKAASSSEDSAGSTESFERIAHDQSAVASDEHEQQQHDEDTEKFGALEREIEQCNALIAEQKSLMEDMRLKLAEKEEALERHSGQLANSDESDRVRRELQESASQVAEMQSKMQLLQQSKQSIEEALRALQMENRALQEQSASKDALKEELDATIASLEKRTAEQSETIAAQEAHVAEMRQSLRSKDQELQAKCAQLENELARMDESSAQLSRLEAQLQQRDASLASLDAELAAYRANASLAEEQLFAARRQLAELQDKVERSRSIEDYSHLQEKLNEREMQVDELQSKLSQRLAETSALRAQAESLQMENERLRQQLQEEERKAADLLDSNQAQEEAVRSAERAKAEVENRLLHLQAVHEESLRHASNVSEELQDAYRMLEQLKIKHTEDMHMTNRRLEDLMEELQARNQELDEKNNLMETCVPDQVRKGLEERTAELEAKLAEAEGKTQAQLEKMKKYAALAKKKTAQCEELEGKLKQLEDRLGLEKDEKEARNRELQESRSQAQQKDNKIVELEQELQRARGERDEAHDRLSAMEQQLKELSEAKDNARELGVRMQVMEAEYMEQLAEINALKTNNGMLQSKQAQINERLENVEKESEERRLLSDKLQKEKEVVESRLAESAARLHELEAKLHERDAEIENLDNELHNSIDNLVQMQDNLRMTSLNSAPQAALQQSYDELLTQFNVLSATSEETKAKHESLMKENEELSERIARLQQLNTTMQERIEAVESELSKDADTAASLDRLNARYSELLQQFDSQKAQLESTRARLHEAMACNENAEHQLRARISLLEQEKHNLQRELEEAKNPVIEANAMGWDLDESSPMIDVQQVVDTVVAREKREALEDAPALFDASVFGASPPGGDGLDQFLASVPQQEQVAELKQTCEQALLDSQVSALNSHLQQLKHDKSELQHAIDVTLNKLGIEHESLNVIEKLSHMNGRIADLMRELEKVKAEKEELRAAEEVCKRRAVELDNQLRVASESAIIADLEERVARIVGERDMLQLQLTDATRSFDERLARVLAERDTLQHQLGQVTRSFDDYKMSMQTQLAAAAEPSAAEASSGDAAALASMWDDNEEDPWGFNDKSKDDHVHIPVVPSAELQLKLKLDELQEKLSELTADNEKLREEGRSAQLKNVKYVKKLKEYKVQLDSVQRQLKSQSSLGGFGADLDSAIEEELKSQIGILEKALSEAKEETKKALLEKDNLLKRIDVLSAATERFTEAKERQDTEVHIWQMRYNELDLKMRQLEGAAEQEAPSQSAPVPEIHKYEQEMKELKDSVEALAAENEELQQLLEEHRSKRQTSLDDQTVQLAQLQSENDKLKSDYDALRRQYEQSLMDADEQVQNTRQSFEMAKDELEQQLRAALEDKEQLEAKVESLQSQLTAIREELLSNQSVLEDRIKGLELSIEGYTVEVQQKAEAVATLQQQLAQAHHSIAELQSELHAVRMQLDKSSVQTAENVPVFTFEDDGKQMESLRAELRAKEAEIEHLSYSLNESSMTHLVQELQENINSLYDEKAALENSLVEKEKQMRQLEESRVEEGERVKRSEEDDGRVVKLERELHERESELAQLRAELERIASGHESERGELYEKQRELESLVSELQSEVANLRGLERLAAEDRASIERLSSEKEQVRSEAEEAINKLLQQKEEEMSCLKEAVAAEKQSLLEAVNARERDLQKLKEQLALEQDASCEQRSQLEMQLSERDRRLAELSISKDTDIHNLGVKLSEVNGRLEELHALNAEEQQQLSEMRQLLEVKEQQMIGLQQQLQEKSKEYELIQHALQRHVGQVEPSDEVEQQLRQSASQSADSSSANELDVALYMLHQRDVRCEELTLELMQLLEERDTLQLRLSNAIRVNEELRKYAAASNANKDPSAAPLIEDPSPSKSEGPVEIAKEAINSPIGEDKKALAQKLSQLKSVHQTKDVRLRDDRELRHTQQMSLLAHKDALNTLPPEAAARLVNANYTVSRDVQSQSSVLMNWLWGKSTPKVVHM